MAIDTPIEEPPQLPEAVISLAEVHERRVAADLNSQYRELKNQSQALLAAVKGGRGMRSVEQVETMLKKADGDLESGQFLIGRLGAERLLEPELMAALVVMRKRLIEEYSPCSMSDTMVIDTIILSYHNLLRVQGWLGNLCIVIERGLFGQAPLDEIHGPTIGEKLQNDLRRLNDQMMPLLDRSHRMMMRSLKYLDERRIGKPASVSVGVAGHVNIGNGLSA